VSARCGPIATLVHTRVSARCGPIATLVHTRVSARCGPIATLVHTRVSARGENHPVLRKEGSRTFIRTSLLHSPALATNDRYTLTRLMEQPTARAVFLATGCPFEFCSTALRR